MKTYSIAFGNGTCMLTVKTVTVEDFETEQDALDHMIDAMEIAGETWHFVEESELVENGGQYHADEYVTGCNHGLHLYHGGNFDIILL